MYAVDIPREGVYPGCHTATTLTEWSAATSVGHSMRRDLKAEEPPQDVTCNCDLELHVISFNKAY